MEKLFSLEKFYFSPIDVDKKKAEQFLVPTKEVIRKSGFFVEEIDDKEEKKEEAKATMKKVEAVSDTDHLSDELSEKNCVTESLKTVPVSVPEEVQKKNRFKELKIKKEDYKLAFIIRSRRMRRRAWEHGLKDGLSQGLAKGYTEGKKKGYEVGYKKGKKQGMEAGYSEIKKETSEKVMPTIEALVALEDYLKNFQALCLSELGQELQLLCYEVCKKVLYDEISFKPEHIGKVIEEAINMISYVEEVDVELNPKDIDILEEMEFKLPEFFKIIKNSEISVGGCIVKTKKTEFDLQIESRMHTCLRFLRESMNLPNKEGSADLE